MIPARLPLMLRRRGPTLAGTGVLDDVVSPWYQPAYLIASRDGPGGLVVSRDGPGAVVASRDGPGALEIVEE